MNTTSKVLIETIIEASAKRQLNQKALAAAARVSEETLSRIKTNGNPTIAVLNRLADAAGMRLIAVPKDSVREQKIPLIDQHSFRDKYKALVWSSSKAGDKLLIQRALLQPRFTVLLDAAVAFGLPRLLNEWEHLTSEPSEEVQRARANTNRILGNIKHGYDKAKA